MFTTGSKLFFGATTLSVAGAVVFGASTGGAVGVMGTVGLVTIAIVFGFLAGINYFNNDGNVPAMQQGIQSTAGAAQPPVGSSMWPLVAAVSVAGLIVGAVSKPVVFKVSLVVALAAVLEWMVQGWSERASADAQYNAALRKRILHPLEFPILGSIGVIAVVYAFSRIMLTIDKKSTPWVFIAVGAVITVGGFVLAGKRQLSRSTRAGVCGLAALVLLGAGVASAVQGQREIELHPTTASDPALCLEGGIDKEVDRHASQDVSLKSNVIANVFLQSDGDLVAFVNGYRGVEYQEIAVPRSATVGLIFHNDSGHPERLTARLGTFGENPEVIKCTTAVNSQKQAYIELKISKTNAASSTPMVLQIAGSEDKVIQIVVP